MNKIWCLFSIACDYNQPKFNLEAWWNDKPNFDDLSKVLQYKEDIINKLLIYNSVDIRSCGTFFIKEVNEGEKLK